MLPKKKTGEKLAENANDILEKAEELSKELGRKVTVEELSEETGIPEEKNPGRSQDHRRSY